MNKVMSTAAFTAVVALSACGQVEPGGAAQSAPVGQEIELPAPDESQREVAEQAPQNPVTVPAAEPKSDRVDVSELEHLLPAFGATAEGVAIDASLVLADAKPGFTLSVGTVGETLDVEAVCVRWTDGTGSGAACADGAEVGFLAGASITATVPQASTLYFAHSSEVAIETDLCDLRTAGLAARTSVSACDLGDFTGAFTFEVSDGESSIASVMQIPDLSTFEPDGR